jgi:DNA-binding NarL/FixJ family response regulator
MVTDGQALFRSGLVRILQDDDRFEVVAESAGGPDVPETCAAVPVDVLVTELELGTTDGIELIRRVGAISPTTRVLVLTSVADSRVIPALAAGASGFVLKDAEPDAIRSAIVSVHLGDQVLCSTAAKWLVEAVSSDGPARERRLTQRETDVVRLMAAGTPNKDIARQLMLSDKTVRNYVSRVYRKLALQNRAQIATYALHNGITR